MNAISCLSNRAFLPRGFKFPSIVQFRSSVSHSPTRRISMSAEVNRTDDLGNVWPADAFPHYLQSAGIDFCRKHECSLSTADLGSPSYDCVVKKGRLIWEKIRREAECDAKSEPLLSSFLYASILGHESFDRALAFVLANRLSNPTMLPTQLFEIFNEVLIENPEVLDAAFEDVAVIREKDPSCCSYSSAVLYFKGFHALQVHRISHALWNRGRKILALSLQSRMSEVFGVDIHPAARMGTGILIDHGTGVVIGETVTIGNNVSILQNVTLGGTGKEGGDRHPKIHDNVLIGASATILGNIVVGKGAQVAAGSLVLKPVPEHVMVAGSPAKVIGKVTGCPSMKMEQWCKKLEAELSLFEESEEKRESKDSTNNTEDSTVVESTRDDDEAQRKWPDGEDPEFNI